ncbi:DUF2304 family protein [Candidatus Gracilibacteria bacterium]|nr:DUF2304 family protein [Candidatus Gracilibacteria bacterium]
MPIYKIIIPVIALIFVLRGIFLWLKGKKTWREIIFWTFFWGFFGFLGAYPQSIEIFAQITGIQDSVKAFFLLIIMILFFIILHMFMKIEKLDRDLTKIIRKFSIEDSEKNK